MHARVRAIFAFWQRGSRPTGPGPRALAQGPGPLGREAASPPRPPHLLHVASKSRRHGAEQKGDDHLFKTQCWAKQDKRNAGWIQFNSFC